MIQSTSIEIYNKIKNNGLINEMQFKIYDTIYHNGPITSNEVFMIHQMETNQSGRFTELSQMGVIHEAEKRKCGITGNTAIAWGTTNSLPDKKKIQKHSDKNKALNMIVAIGKVLPEKHRPELRDIYFLVKKM